MFTNKSTQSEELFAKVYPEVLEIIDRFVPFDSYATIGLAEYQIMEIADSIYSKVFRDINSFLDKGWAGKSTKYILDAYKSFEAVMYYRIANTFYYWEYLNIELREERALAIYESAKVETGVDIHPAAIIGERFAIDHGIGTVIGETCKIGDDCYMLQKVILGSKSIKNDTRGIGHPTIGNRVIIAAFVRIVGNIKIGDDVAINPHCIITQNIPSNTKVVIVNQLQLHSPSAKEKVKIYGVIPENNGKIFIYGTNFKNPCISLLNDDFEDIDDVKCSVISWDPKSMEIHLHLKDQISPNRIREYVRLLKVINIKITIGDDSIIITNSLGLAETIESLICAYGS